MLYEIYRAEQDGFDAVGLSLANSNASVNLATKGIEKLGGSISSAFGGGEATGAGIGGLLGGVLGVDSPNANALGQKNITTLAQMAFSVEMYYNGWVFRGYFDSMVINERADSFLFDYTMIFNATQRRGYRVNYMPWQRTPDGQPSQYNTPYSSAPYKVTG